MTKPAQHSAVGAPLAGARAAPDGRRQATPLRFSLWLWVAGAFLLLGLVWGVLFTVAHGAQVQSVPLATKGGRP